MSKEGWAKVGVGKNAAVSTRPISEEIIQQMPLGESKTFLNHSIVDIVNKDLRKLLGLNR